MFHEICAKDVLLEFMEQCYSTCFCLEVHLVPFVSTVWHFFTRREKQLSQSQWIGDMKDKWAFHFQVAAEESSSWKYMFSSDTLDFF